MATDSGESRRVSATICNERGLHARAAAKFVQCAEQFDAEVTVTKGGVSVSGRSIMGLMMLAAGRGAVLEIAAIGRQADAALAALSDLVANGFDED